MFWAYQLKAPFVIVTSIVPKKPKIFTMSGFFLDSETCLLLCGYFVTKFMLIKKMQAAFAPFATFSKSVGFWNIIVQYLII